MAVIDWLLDSDPSIRWQVMRDLTDEPADVVAAERARVAKEGWGARLLALQGADGQWGGGTLFPKMLATTSSLMLLRDFGLDPASAEARRAVALVREHSRWEHAGQPFFEGEVEPCINGRAVTIGAYFGQDVQGIVDRLLTEQMADGGWNCEQENGSTRGSFNSTICVLEGLLEHERASGATAEMTAARLRGQEYLLERRLLRRLSTGEVIDPDWTRFSYPTDYFYDVLRGLDYLRSAGATPDDRMAEAIDIVRTKPDAEGRWPLENPHPGDLHFAIDEGEGRPSRWNTPPCHAGPALVRGEPCLGPRHTRASPSSASMGRTRRLSHRGPSVGMVPVSRRMVSVRIFTVATGPRGGTDDLMRAPDAVARPRTSRSLANCPAALSRPAGLSTERSSTRSRRELGAGQRSLPRPGAVGHGGRPARQDERHPAPVLPPVLHGGRLDRDAPAVHLGDPPRERQA